MARRFVRGMAGIWVLLAAVALGLAPAAQASSVTATSWIELDGSGTHDGLSRSATGVRILERNVAVAVDPDGDPVVAYVEAPSGNVIVKQLIFGAWRQLGTTPGQGVTPRVKVHTDGTVNVAWLGPTAVFLARWTGVAWVGLAGSNTGTGLTGPVNPLSFDFALDQDGNPVVALDAPPASGNDCLATGTVGLAGEQIYVVQWDGVAWNYLGSDPTGSGASNALSFQIPGTSQAVCHSAVMPSVVVDSSGAPVVAFVYTTGSNAPSPPATFYIGTNSDVYAARWDGAGWLGVGPAVPTQPVGAGLGQAGGISANANASAPPGSPVAPATPSIAIGTDNRPVVAWSDNSADPNQTRVLLRKFSQDVRTFNIATAVWAMIGTNTSTSTVISPTSGRNELPVVAIGESDRPLVAWQTIGPTGAASVYIRRFNGTTGFIDVTTGSASGTGVNGPDVQGLAPALAVGPATAFTPILAWLGNGTSDPQVFARELGTGAMSTLSVTLTGGGAGTVTSVPSGISCPTRPGECSQVFPTGTEVTLTATPDPGLTFGGWSGACTNPTGPCVVTLTATKTVTANFVGAKLTVNVNGSGSGIAVSAPGGHRVRARLLPGLCHEQHRDRHRDGVRRLVLRRLERLRHHVGRRPQHLSGHHEQRQDDHRHVQLVDPDGGEDRHRQRDGDRHRARRRSHQRAHQLRVDLPVVERRGDHARAHGHARARLDLRQLGGVHHHLRCRRAARPWPAVERRPSTSPPRG